MITVYHGDNNYALKRAVDEDLKAFDDKYEIVRISADKLTTDGLAQLLTGISLFGASQAVVLTRLAEDKLLWDKLAELLPRVDVDQPVLIVEPTLDKRTKAYKLLAEVAKLREFKQPTDYQLVDWLQAEARSSGANLEPEAARYLIRFVGTDQARLASELDKLVLVSSSIDRELIDKYCQPTPEASAYEIIDLVVAGKRTELADKLAALSANQDPYMFFGLLSSQVVGLQALKAAGQRPTAEIAKDLSLSAYALGKLRPLSTRLDASRIKLMLGALADCDMQIKTSSTSPWQAIELALMKLS
ncbi:MAG TPA: DNA polymerase III subunit delta [Candidatus Saccharimonadales bacterium]|nr:DNA polymerase III subunit delta [Candidatus Saccharimonadales bacterium]